MKKVRLFGLAFTLALAGGAYAVWANPAPPSYLTENHPEITTDEAVLFAESPDHPAVKVRSGDIALRLGEDIQIAIGTYPVPRKIVDDIDDADGANWEYYHEVYKQLHVPGVKHPHFLAELVESTLKLDAFLELGRSKSQIDVPKHLRFSHREFIKMRGRYKKFVFDDFGDQTPEGQAHKKIPGFMRNFFKLNGMNEDEAKKAVHYYPGTPFVSHAGMISVERENGVPRIYIYDAVPGKSGNPIEDERFPSGLRKITPEDFFGTNEAYYGVIVRPTITTPEQDAQAAEAAWKRFHAAQHQDQDLFDYTFDWRNPAHVACSPFVWRSYIEGAGANIVSDLNMTLVPAWVIRRKSDYTVKMNLQVAPQSLAESLYTQRIVDFESKPFEEHLKAVSAGKPALPLPAKDTRDPDTGHFVYSTDHVFEANPGAKKFH